MSGLGYRIFGAAIAVVAAMCTACGSDHFSVKGSFADGGTQNVRIVYGTDDGFEVEWVTMSDSRFAFEGCSEEPTVLYVFNQQKRLLAHAVVSNGDDIEIEGNIASPYTAAARGTKVNEQWSAFVEENGKAFASADPTAADAAIEKFIGANPDNVVSTLLLTNDYSRLTDKKKVESLLSKISTEARPESIMKHFYAMQAMQVEEAKKENIQTMQFYTHRDSTEMIMPYRFAVSLLYFWRSDDKTRQSDFGSVRDFDKELGSKRFQVADINIDSDTVRWKNAIRRDSVKWVRYWAVGGFTNLYLRNLRLTSTPYYIVADSTGRQIYQGESFAEASKAVEKRLGKNPGR